MIKTHSYLLPIFLLLVLFGCGSLADQDVIEINGMEIRRGLINEITSKVGAVYNLNAEINWRQDPATDKGFVIDTIRNGLYYSRIAEDKATGLIRYYSDMLSSEGNYMFMTNGTYNRKGVLCYDLVIVKANDQFQVLKIVRPESVAEGVSHDQIFDLLLKLHQVNPVRIYIADDHRISMNLKNPLSSKWEEEIAQICPQYELTRLNLSLQWDR